MPSLTKCVTLALASAAVVAVALAHYEADGSVPAPGSPTATGDPNANVGQIGPEPGSPAAAATKAATQSTTMPMASTTKAANASTTTGAVNGTATTKAATTAVNGTKTNDSACFPAGATVLLESGEVKTMGDLAVGDRVHVGRGVFSDVFMFTHKSADVANLFVEMTTVSGAVLRATPGHYLYVNGALSAAKAVVAGDLLELASGAADAVAAVRSVTDFGLYNPQTVQGDVVVDGVRASTYTTAVEPALAHAALSPLRAVYGVFGAATAALDNGSPLADLLPSGAAAVY